MLKQNLSINTNNYSYITGEGGGVTLILYREDVTLGLNRDTTRYKKVTNPLLGASRLSRRRKPCHACHARRGNICLN